MRKALFAATLLPVLFAGMPVSAGDNGFASSSGALFSGALAYDSLSVPDTATRRPGGLSAEDFSVDLYNSEIGPLGVSLGTGFTRDAAGEEPNSYMVGLRFDFGSLSLASQWRGREGEICGLADGFCDDGPAWNIGASYTTGAASLSAQYHALNPLEAEGLKPGGDIFRLGIDYQIFDGVSSHADAYYIDGGQGLTQGDSTVVLIGTRITF